MTDVGQALSVLVEGAQMAITRLAGVEVRPVDQRLEALLVVGNRMWYYKNKTGIITKEEDL